MAVVAAARQQLRLRRLPLQLPMPRALLSEPQLTGPLMPQTLVLVAQGPHCCLPLIS